MTNRIWNKGIPHAQEVKDKISKSKKGIPSTSKTKFKKGQAPWNKGVLGSTGKRIGFKHSEETKAKLSAARIGKSVWNKGLKGVCVAWNKGIPMTEEAKKHLSEKKKGFCASPNTTFKKGLVPWNNGVKMSDKAKAKMIVSKKKTGYRHSPEMRKTISESHRGEKSYSWRGGITAKSAKIRNSVEYKLWRDAVYARDGYTCQKTGERGGKLTVHHIYNFADYPDLRLAIDNGITLTIIAHREFHKRYGNKNNTKDQLIEFLNRNK